MKIYKKKLVEFIKFKQSTKLPIKNIKYINSVDNNVKYFTNVVASTQSQTFFFLRKQKCFNKGRYSRNRQIYRTGVYWCFYLNIAALLGLNFLFYKFTITFSYYWWFFFIFINFFFIPILFRHRLYNYRNIIELLNYSFFFFSKFIEILYKPQFILFSINYIFNGVLIAVPFVFYFLKDTYEDFIS